MKLPDRLDHRLVGMRVRLEVDENSGLVIAWKMRGRHKAWYRVEYISLTRAEQQYVRRHAECWPWKR